MIDSFMLPYTSPYQHKSFRNFGHGKVSYYAPKLNVMNSPKDEQKDDVDDNNAIIRKSQHALQRMARCMNNYTCIVQMLCAEETNLFSKRQCIHKSLWNRIY